jgi:hypothetical protein
MLGEGGELRFTRETPRLGQFEHASAPVRCVVSRAKRPDRSVSYGRCGGREGGGVAKPPKSHSQIRYSMALTSALDFLSILLRKWAWGATVDRWKDAEFPRYDGARPGARVTCWQSRRVAWRDILLREIGSALITRNRT